MFTLDASALAALRAHLAAAITAFLGPDFRGPVLVEIRTETGESHTLRVLPGGSGSTPEQPAERPAERPPERPGGDPAPADAYPPGRLPDKVADTLQAADRWLSSRDLCTRSGWGNPHGRWRNFVARLWRLGWLERENGKRTGRLRRTRAGADRLAEHEATEEGED